MSDVPEALSSALADRYRLERELGQGGMATVYLAQDLRHQRLVALKVLRPDLAASLGPERFKREIDIAARLQHPHILPLFESGEAAGFLYYVMPFVEGQTLRARLVKEGELPTAEVVRILRDVVDGVAAAHEMGVVHRDLKPENVMLSGRHALVADFGVAKALSDAAENQRLTTAGVAMGTPAYMSPEQAAGDTQTDHRADIYALGVIAYEMLTGDPPFMRSNPRALLAAQVTEAPVPVTERRDTVPPALAALVMRCLAKKPADRPQHADELLQVLESLATPSGGLTPVDLPPLGTAAVRSRPRGRAALLAGAGAVVLLGALAVVVLKVRTPPLPPEHLREPIVVLPFTVQGSAPALEGLGVDAADRLASAIEGSDVGRAVAWQSAGEAARFTRRLGARALQQAGGGTLVTGTIQQSGDRIEVEARLIRGSDLGVIWTLGPERGSAADPAAVLERMRERALAAVLWYLSPDWGRLHQAEGYQPPPSVAAAKLADAGFRHFNAGEFAAAVPLLRQAYDRDTMWLAPLPWLKRAAEISMNVRLAEQADSMYDFLMARRERLTGAEVALIEYFKPFQYGSPEEELAAARNLMAVDSPFHAASATESFGMNRRASEALRYYAMIDTAGLPVWNAGFRAADVYHMLQDFQAELRLVRNARARSPGDLNLWRREVGALAGLGRNGEIERLITESNVLEDIAAPVWLMITAATEFATHGRQAEAHAYAERALGAVNEWPESSRGISADVILRVPALRVLGRYPEIIDIYYRAAGVVTKSAGMARSIAHRGRGMQFRVLQGDTVGALALVDSLRRDPWPGVIPGDGPYLGASILAHLGRKQEAVDMLREAMNNGKRFDPVDDAISWVFAPLRDYPPYQELAKIR